MEKTANIAILAINNYIDIALNSITTADVYNALRKEFSLTDESIASLGYAWLIPEESNEPDETPKKTYRFIYHVYLDTVIEVQAHSEEEAEKLAEAQAEELNYTDIECYDTKLELMQD